MSGSHSDFSLYRMLFMMDDMRDEKYQIRAILFDLGETLINFGTVNTARLFRAGAHLSYDFLKSFGQPVGNFGFYCWRNLIPLRINYWLSNITRNDFDSLTLLRRISEKKGVRLSEEQWQHLAWLWYEPLSKFGKVEPDIVHTLTFLKESGLKLGIVSNTFIHGSSLDRHLEQLGILDFFEFRFYSYEFDFRKPDTRIFRVAAEKIGESPENVLFAGDRIDNDIRPAIKAGMHAVLKAAYTNAGKSPPDGVLRINTLSELPGLIQKINAEVKN